LGHAFAGDRPAGLTQQGLRPWPPGTPAGQVQCAGENALLIGILRQFRCCGQGRGMTWLLAKQFAVEVSLVLPEVISGISARGRGRKAFQECKPELPLLGLQSQSPCRQRLLFQCDRRKGIRSPSLATQQTPSTVG